MKSSVPSVLSVIKVLIDNFMVVVGYCSFRFLFFPIIREGHRMLPFPLRGCGAYWGQIQFTQWA